MKIMDRLRRFADPTPPRSRTAKAIIERMQKSGLSYQEIADKTHVSRTTLDRWRADVVPQHHMLERLKTAAAEYFAEIRPTFLQGPGLKFSLEVNFSELTPETRENIKTLKRILTEIEERCPE